MKFDEYLHARKNIDRKRDEIAEIEALCESVTQDPSQERVQSSGTKDRLGMLVTKKIALEDELIVEIINALDVMMDIEEEIGKLEDPDEQIVMHDRFIRGKSWDEIGVDIGATGKTAQRVKDRAIAKMSFTVP